MSFLNKFDFYKVVGDSMNPFFREGSLIVCSKNIDNLKRGSIIIFKNKPTEINNIKRIIGLPSEKIEIVDGILLINERMHEYNDSFKFPLNLSNNVNQWILTNDQYFVIGDNILNSTDSRNYGLVKKSQISYKFICKMWY